MKQRKISKTNVVNFSTYLGMVIFFLAVTYTHLTLPTNSRV